jgi:hypothetical protein
VAVVVVIHLLRARMVVVEVMEEAGIQDLHQVVVTVREDLQV